MGQNLDAAHAPREHRDVPRVLIQLRVTEAERAAMKSAADKSGLTLSEWIRQRCLVTTTKIKAPVIKPKRK